MEILITGKGSSGSWKIRAEQLGEAIGAIVQPNAEPHDCKQADVIVVVKRTPRAVLDAVRRSGKPWVWDIVDAWPQPFGNAWGRDSALDWLRSELDFLKPNAVVFPTTQMRLDSEWERQALVLPHHAWPKYSPHVVSEKVARVGYEGAAHYLGRWQEVVEKECSRRGWEFKLGGLEQCDIGVAFRDVGGYPAKAWKANTKLANMQALGIPFVGHRELSYVEFGSGSEFFVDTREQLAAALDALACYEARLEISEAMQAACPVLESVAAKYANWLRALA